MNILFAMDDLSDEMNAADARLLANAALDGLRYVGADCPFYSIIYPSIEI